MNSRMILMFLSLVFITSCSNTKEELGEDWIVDLKSEIKAYDIKAKMIDEAIHSKSKTTSKIEKYSKNDYGLYKLRTIHEVMDTYVFEIIIYSKDNQIIYVTEKGISPLIYKRKKDEDEPCCSIFERQIYFNSNGDYKALKKEIKMLNTSELELKSKELKAIVFQRDSINNVHNKYEQIKANLESGVEYFEQN